MPDADRPWTVVPEEKECMTGWGKMLISLVDYLEESGHACLRASPCNPPSAAAGVEAFIKASKPGQEHGFSTLFDPWLIDACCVRGVFPMSLSPFENCFFFGPKLHVTRMVLDLEKFKAKRSSVKKSKGYSVSVNDHFREGVRQVVYHHGRNWMCEPLVKAFEYMLTHPKNFRTRMMSISIWDDETDQLVASEVGFGVGTVYTSLSGATEVSGAGSVQLCTLGCILRLSGFTHWDFGMAMDYKSDLGASNISRKEWLALITKKADEQHSAPVVLKLDKPREPCVQVMARDAAQQHSKTTSETASAERQAAKALKLSKKEEKRRRANEWRAANLPDRRRAATTPPQATECEAQQALPAEGPQLAPEPHSHTDHDDGYMLVETPNATKRVRVSMA